MGPLPHLDQIEGDGQWPLLKWPAFPSHRLCLEDICRVLDSIKPDHGPFIILMVSISRLPSWLGGATPNWRIKSHLL